MRLDESVTDWISQLQAGDSHAASRLWQRYFQILAQLAEERIPVGVKRDFDGEDVALSALDSLFRGVRENRYPQLDDRDNLWSLLVVITARKAINRLRDGSRQKRGGGNVRGESGFGVREDLVGIQQVIGKEPSPEFAVEMADQCERLLSALPSDAVRELAKLKLEGMTNAEAARVLEYGKRTVERRMTLIRTVWEAHANDLL